MENEKSKIDLQNFFLEKVMEAEGLIVAKTKVYSRLLTDGALAQEMEKIALKREKSKSAWLEILTGEPQKSSGDLQGENSQSQNQSQEQGENE